MGSPQIHPDFLRSPNVKHDPHPGLPGLGKDASYLSMILMKKKMIHQIKLLLKYNRLLTTLEFKGKNAMGDEVLHLKTKQNNEALLFQIRLNVPLAPEHFPDPPEDSD